MSSESHADPAPKTPPQPDTPDEISRTRFMAQATVVLGGVVGLGLVVPLAATLWPKPELLSANKGWSSLSATEFAALKASIDKPVKITFTKKNVIDGYLVSDNSYYVWGVHMNAAEESQFREQRPDLFDPKSLGDVTFPVGTMGFVMFSSVCPHLQCKFDWDDGLKAFLCPCHGSQFSKFGVHMKKPDGSFIGPAPRGLDPVPFREQSGIAEVEWVKYFANVPYRMIVSYS
ncbi:MAG TPA: Rieske 2Fe-2S domain-containing protein [Candidatus Tumulicola sp.]|nr:Rieske 2Fe-2S domain-containing protein [Candidatus Tumulicola sp.]